LFLEGGVFLRLKQTTVKGKMPKKKIKQSHMDGGVKIAIAIFALFRARPLPG
jgi:hypothetical protein